MYSGNAVVVNFLMRWPVLIPVAVAVGVAAVIPKPAPPAPKPPPIIHPVVVVPVAPVASAPIVLKPIETLCPPVKETRKLSKTAKKALRDKGCKVKG